MSNMEINSNDSKFISSPNQIDNRHDIKQAIKFILYK